jgi:thiol-disulfide isomerase/thioredoxin
MRFFSIMIALLCGCLLARGNELKQVTSNARQIADSVTYPEIGKPCPDFVLRNIKYYSKKQATLKDFRGKWLLLDFWSRRCSSCVDGFPRVNEIQKTLGDKVQVMMIGYQDPEGQISMIYDRYRAKEKLTMPCVFDSVLVKRFDYFNMPRAILIDDKGIVRCLTTTVHLEEMKAFLAGETPDMPRAYRMNEDPPVAENHMIPFDYNKLFAIKSNGAVDSEFLFRSMLTAYKPGITRAVDCPYIESGLTGRKGSFCVLGVDLKELYTYAYLGLSPDGLLNRVDPHYGKYYPKLALEVADSSFFKVDDKTGENYFCYSVDLPPSQANAERVKKVMQRDLENYFGFVVSIETRKCPCWKLVATPSAKEKLKSKGGPSSSEGLGVLSYKVRNKPFQDIVHVVQGLQSEMSIGQKVRLVFDETGIIGNVDMVLDCKDGLLTDFNDMKKALQANGLDLVPEEREMKVLVVRDGAK